MEIADGANRVHVVEYWSGESKTTQTLGTFWCVPLGFLVVTHWPMCVREVPEALD
jgi:hypothetical protein